MVLKSLQWQEAHGSQQGVSEEQLSIRPAQRRAGVWAGENASGLGLGLWRTHAFMRNQSTE